MELTQGRSAGVCSFAIYALLAMLLLIPGIATAEFVGGGAVYIKGGAMSLHDSHQVFGQYGVPNTLVDLENTSEKLFNFGWELRLPHGIAAGTEYLRYRNQFTPASSTTARGEAQSDVFAATVKKYFFIDSHFRPYVGGGLGFALTEINNKPSGGVLEDYNNHIVAHAMIGAEARVSQLSFLLEYRLLEYLVEKNKTDYNPSGMGVFLGMGITWH